MSEQGLPFGFDTYGTSKGGLVVGAKYKSADSGKTYRFCQAHTTFVGSALVATATQHDPVVQVGTTIGVATDDVSAGLSTTNPICLGVPTSACPVSTGSVTYYFWALTNGLLTTTDTGSTLTSIAMNNDDDAAAGDAIIMTSTDAACNTIASGSASGDVRQVGFAIVGVTAGTNLTTGVFVRTVF